MSDPLIGSELAGYRIEELVGRGGMGVVYRAEHTLLGRQDAVKLLAPDLAEDQSFRDRFLRESRLAASLDHPNVIPIYHAGEVEGVLYLAMKYVEGTDLRTVLREQGRVPRNRTLAIAEQVASALDAAHARGLVHRDVKPANILIAPGDRVYLTDFGIAKHTATRGGLTQTGSFVGTLDYAAPEQIEGKHLDGRADLYSLGCVLYECLTGAVPFEKDSEVQLIYAHLLERPKPPTDRSPDLAPAVDDVIARALAKSPVDRFGNCDELVAALREALDRAPSAVARETRPAPLETRAAPRVEPTGSSEPSGLPQPPPLRPAEAPPPPAAPPPARPPSVAEPEPEPPPAPLRLPARTGRRRLGVAAAAVIVLAATVALAAMLFSGGGAGAFPNASERQLLAYIPAAIRGSCLREDDLPAHATAGVVCSSPRRSVAFYRFPDTRLLNRFYGTERRASGLAPNTGTCEEQPLGGERPYRIQGRQAGRIFCAPARPGGGPTIGWTTGRAAFYARATSRRGGVAGLLPWWRKSAGPLQSPGGRRVPVHSAALPRGTVIFADDFSDRSSGWSTSEDSPPTLSYARGSYQILVKRPKRLVSSSTGDLPRSLQFGSVSVVVSATKVAGPRQFGFGLLCRSRYVLRVDSDGVASISKLQAGTIKDLETRRFGRSLSPRRHRIRADCIGGATSSISLTLRVDGRQVARATSGRAPATGVVGVVAESGRRRGGIVVRFDNFAVLKG